MDETKRKALTNELQSICGRIATYLQEQILAGGEALGRARHLHAEERVAEDFTVWTDLLSRRAAVLWVLKSVYVRVLEDRGMLSPRRILGRESQELFGELAPNLGETAYLRWVYRDLAQPAGGLPELFARQPAEVCWPSDALSQELIQLWRGKDQDTGELHYAFDGERFDGQLMGDLYQDLDPVVKDRYALLQTPDFVRDFILDDTLTPALDKWGAEAVRLLDPACGSGHFLLEAFTRLVEATQKARPDMERVALVKHALARVVGIDLNDYACALARARLIMKALELCGLNDLSQAGQFHPQVYWADALEQVERDEQKEAEQLGLWDERNAVPEEAKRAVMTRPEVRAALRPVLKEKFQAVVGNPPYITEKDKAKKKYHRQKLGGKQRYFSAYREYSLASPFTERCFQLAEEGGYIGLITGNNFMKRHFGKALIERVLAAKDLWKVVDTSQAAIPNHGTPTVIFFAHNQRPRGDSVLVVMGKRGESTTPKEAAKGKVWASIVEGHHQVGFENAYVSVDEVPREIMGLHPWSLEGGGAANLKMFIENQAEYRLKDKIGIGIGLTVRVGADEVFVRSKAQLLRCGFSIHHIRRMLKGEEIRDWSVSAGDWTWYPYDPQTREPPKEESQDWAKDIEAVFPWKARMSNRATFQGIMADAGLRWFEYMQHTSSAYSTPSSIAFPFLDTHAHFVFDRGGKVFKQTAPVIKLPEDAEDTDFHLLIGALNSSTSCFWLKQICHTKGGISSGKKMQSESWSRRKDFDSTKVKQTPLPPGNEEVITAMASQLDALSQQLGALQPEQVVGAEKWHTTSLDTELEAARTERQKILAQMVALQEELDWVCYEAFGLADGLTAPDLQALEPLAPEHRPFEIRLAHEVQAGDRPNYWFETHERQPCLEVPDHYSAETRDLINARREAIEESKNLRLLEAPDYKRRWIPRDHEEEAREAVNNWILEHVEQVLGKSEAPVTARKVAAALQDNQPFIDACEYLEGRQDFALEALLGRLMEQESVASHPPHTYTATGLNKRKAWEKVWELQRKKDAGEKLEKPIDPPPDYSQGSRGKSTDFVRTEYWKLRGKLDVPKERYIAFTEAPGQTDPLYGWAGWTPAQRVRAILLLDEELEDQGVAVDDRVALLDSAWRLLPDVARDDTTAASQFRAELQSVLGEAGPPQAMLDSWKERFPPPRKKRCRRKN